jgi:rfaE bifunctional protein nucleotidyltransferase chain/domain
VKTKIISSSKLRTFARRLRRTGKKVIFTNGVFDIVHAGHVSYLARAKSLGDILVVGLNTDASTRLNKGRNRPLVPYRHRATVLAGLEAVDYVVPLARKTPDKLIELIHPDILVKGADYKISEIVGAEFVHSYGGRVVRMKLTGGLSTSELARKIKK